MTLADFKNKMKSTLSSIYEIDELNSFFFLLSENYLQIPRSKILLADEIELDSNKERLFLDALNRLKAYEPVQYVLGKTTFMDLEFYVNSSVLIPRPETEDLVRLMLKEGIDDKEILDVGTGSGCIAISLAKNLPNSKLTALDISEEAIDVARENAKLNNVNVDFINADIFNYKSEKKYDVIVSNPPYVTESEKALMKKNVLDFEPELALFVNNDKPLRYYTYILEFANINLSDKGFIFFEINDKFKDGLKSKINEFNFSEFKFINDFNNKIRFLFIRK